MSLDDVDGDASMMDVTDNDLDSAEEDEADEDGRKSRKTSGTRSFKT
jgi:hypothetical protein